MKSNMVKGRYELLKILNSILSTDYQKIEYLKDGIAYCKLLDLIYPYIININNIIYNTKNDDDNIKNLKLLDNVFRSLNIKKEISYVKLAAGNFQENFDFLNYCITLYKNAPSYNTNNINTINNNKNLDHYVSSTNLLPSSLSRANSISLANSLSLVNLNNINNLSKQNSVDDDTSVWKKKEQEMEELMVSLTADLNVRMQNIKSTIADPVLELEREFYLEKLIRIEDVIRNDSSLMSDLIRDVLKERSQILNQNQ